MELSPFLCDEKLGCMVEGDYTAASASESLGCYRLKVILNYCEGYLGSTSYKIYSPTCD